MRVLMVTPSYYPIKGGTEIVVRNLSIELNKQKISTDVLTFNMDKKWNPKWQGKIDKIDKITVYKIPALKWLLIPTRFDMKINLLPGKFTHFFKNYDIIHFHETDLSFPLFSYFVKKPKIFHFHGIDNDYMRRFILHRYILKNIADYYITITKQMKKDLIEFGFPSEKLIYLPNGVDTTFFIPGEEKEGNLLLFVGRIEHNKGLHVLLDSLRYIKKGICLVIVGPSDWNLEYCKNIEERIKKENKKGIHEIKYLGKLNQTELIKWYQKASILILPSFREGLPMVILEALSCETPVISTPVGGVPEVIKKSNGILVPINDSLKLSISIQYLLDNETVRYNLGVTGRKMVIDNYSLQTMVKKLCNIYKNINDI